MSRYHSYLNSAIKIIESYRGEEPLASFLKKYFAQHKKFGAKDRKEVANLCYCYFRLGKAAPPPPEGEILEDPLKIEGKILAGLFLCSDRSNEILEAIKPDWNTKTGLSINEKLSSLNYQLSSVFPWEEELSDGIEYEKFCAAFFIQPDLFLRIRPGHAEKVLLKLNETAADYEFISPFTIRLPNTFNAGKYFDLDKEVVVQDYSSQRVGNYLFAGQTPSTAGVRSDKQDRVWDCCAGSGGKSILAYDLNRNIELNVSDLRKNILVNLERRFQKAGIKKYNSFIADLSHSPLTIHYSQFDLIIADVPCTGSGTWGRTPEQLFFFDKKKIDEYATTQRNIVSNVIPHLKPGGHFLYITCSVFKKENEEVVDFFKEKFHLGVVKMELIKGYELKADSMFAALLQKPL